MHAFQQQDAALTLAQGLQQYHAAHPELAAGRALSAAAREFFRCHDVAHVIFGCDTTLDDEAAVKIASILGTTAGLAVLRGYRLHASRAIYRRLRARDVLLTLAHAVVIVPRTVARCLRQRARWPWSEHGPYLQRPLAELRQAFGIRVAHGRAAPGAP